MGAWFSRDDAAAAPLPTPSAVADVSKPGTVASIEGDGGDVPRCVLPPRAARADPQRRSRAGPSSNARERLFMRRDASVCRRPR